MAARQWWQHGSGGSAAAAAARRGHKCGGGGSTVAATVRQVPQHGGAVAAGSAAGSVALAQWQQQAPLLPRRQCGCSLEGGSGRLGGSSALAVAGAWLGLGLGPVLF